MTLNIFGKWRKKSTAAILALTLILAPISASNSTFADVLNGEPPVQAMMTLGQVFDTISSGDEMSYEDYRLFFKDFVDTADALIQEFETGKAQLHLVMNKLEEFENSVSPNLSTYGEVLQRFSDRRKHYASLRDALLGSITGTIQADGSIVYENINRFEPAESMTLIDYPNGDFRLYKGHPGDQTLVAFATDGGYAILKATDDPDDATMFDGHPSEIYVGTMCSAETRDGFGAAYTADGSITAGHWVDDEINGYGYIYDGYDSTANVMQFKEGLRHGMAIYRSSENGDVSARLYKNDKLHGLSFSEYDYGDYTAQLMHFYEEGQELPVTYIYYPQTGDQRLIVENTETSVEMYRSDYYQRTFVGDLSGGSLNGFGYSLVESIEYIGSFNRFNILGDGTFFKFGEEEPKFDRKVDEVLSEIITDDMTERQQIMAIHDYLVDRIDYHMPDAALEDHPGYTHTAYGAVVYGSAVCDGYAQAFKIMLDRLGIENQLIFGITTDENGRFLDTNRHAWNLVKVDGKYLHFDLTWNDPVFRDTIHHTYIFMTSDQIRKDHMWIEEDYEIFLNGN